jgi:hypothetical protein
MGSIRALIGSVVLLASFFASLHAEANGRRRQPVRPVPPYSQPYLERREVWIDRTLNVDLLDLSLLLDLRRNYGDVVQSVDVAIRGFGIGKLSLTFDGQKVDSRDKLFGHVTFVPNRSARIGIDFRSLGLLAIGNIHVDRVVVNILRYNNYPPAPMPPPIPNPGSFDLEQGVYQTYYGFGRLDVGQLVGLYRYMGYQVVSVEIIGGAVGPRSGQATLLANGSQQGVASFYYQNVQSQLIYMRGMQTVGRDVNSLVLAMSGDMRIDRVKVRLFQPR